MHTQWYIYSERINSIDFPAADIIISIKQKNSVYQDSGEYMKNKLPILIGVILITITAYLSTGKTKTIVKVIPPVKNKTNTTAKIIWPVESQDKKIAGEGVGVAADDNGNIYYLQRGKNKYDHNKKLIQEPVIIIIDSKTDNVIKRIGQNIFKSPHGISVDQNRNIWVTDIELNEVIKLSNDGTVLNRYGAKYPFYLDLNYRIKNVLPKFPLFTNTSIFARPTDVVVNRDGSFIVTDGYRNNRVVKFNKDGKFIWEINADGNKPGEFNLPHGIAEDKKGNIYIADRQNERIQVLSPEGKFLYCLDNPEFGRPYGVDIGPDGNLYIADGGDMLDVNQKYQRSTIIISDATGNVIERFGTYGENEGQLNIPHDIVVGNDGIIYVAELHNKRLQKITILSEQQ